MYIYIFEWILTVMVKLTFHYEFWNIVYCYEIRQIRLFRLLETLISIKNIIITGGIASMNGFANRHKKELKTHIPEKEIPP